MPSNQKSDGQHQIKIANNRDLSYVIHLQKTWSNQVGFLPKAALQRYIDNRATLLVHLNGQHAGYLSWQLTRKGLLRIIQIAIDPELLRGQLGTALVAYIEAAARRGSCSVIRCQTRIDLDVNLFANVRGYHPTAIFQSPTARRRPLIEWTKCLFDPVILTRALLNRKVRYHRKSPIPLAHIVHP